MRFLLIICGFVIAGANVAAAAPLPVMQFSLPAADGYTLQVKTERHQTLVTAFRGSTPESSSTYYVSGSAEPGVIDAELGLLGRIDVHFEPSGVSKMVDFCQGTRQILRRLGVFTGTISFRGENGYTAVEASRAPGSIGPPARGRCHGRGRARPATTSAARRTERIWAVGDATLMNRNTSSPGEDSLTLLLASAAGTTARYLAYRIELPRPGLAIQRQVEAVGPRAGFSYPHDYRSAVLRPPAPFSGEATFSARRQRLSGDLEVEFPGLPPQTLTDGQFEAKILPVR